MLFRCLATALLCAGLPTLGLGQTAEDPHSSLFIELNATETVSGACRLTFVARNETGVLIDKASFQTVFFDTTGKVISLTLFNFQDLPVDRIRVRQFELKDTGCDAIGQTLINGTNTCLVDGSESEICQQALSLSSRVDMELLG